MSGTNATLVRVAWALGLALLAGCAAPGAVIRGTVDGGRGEHGSLLPKSAMPEAVIYLDSLPAAAGHAKPRPAAASAQLAISSRGFEPRTVVVTRGDSLVFANRDQHWHSPFSVSTARRFELGALPPGKRRALRFQRSGVVRVFCKLHSEASAAVFVAPTPVWTRPDSTGAFSLPGLPPGEYDLKLWHPRYGERRWHVTLPRRGVELQLSL